MKLSEFIERYPQFERLGRMLPEDSYLRFDGETQTIEMGMRLEVKQQMSYGVAMDADFTWLPDQWYRRMFEELIKSQVEWEKKVKS